MRSDRFLAALCAVLLCLSCPLPASAQGYPDRTIKVVVPFTPGSPVDAAARVLVQQLQTRLGQGVVIENRAGAGTTIGTKAVATAPPDGYTLLLAGTQLVYLPLLYSSFDAATAKSLVPIASVVGWSHMIVVNPAVRAETLGELVAFAKANPGALVFGFGQGSAPQILGTSLARAAGIELTMLSYRGGDEARTDLLGGRVHINIAPVASLLALIQDGKARPLAYTGAARNRDLPNVPTTTELGFPSVGYNPDTWVGMLAPPGTSPRIVGTLSAAVKESLGSAEMKATLSKLGFDEMFKTPEEFARFLAAETAKWPPLLEAAGIKAQ